MSRTAAEVAIWTVRPGTAASSSETKLDRRDSVVHLVPPGRGGSGVSPTSSFDLEGGVSTLHVSIARAIALKSADNYDGLVKEHGELIDKEYEGGLSNAERRRLSMVRWEIDQIEIARFGEGVKFLNELASRQQDLAREVTTLVSRLSATSTQRPVRRLK